MFHVIANHGRPTLGTVSQQDLGGTTDSRIASISRQWRWNSLSYYNHYVPSPVTTAYTAKKSPRSMPILKCDTGATRALLTRRDVVVVAGVSCLRIWAAQEYLDARRSVKCHGGGGGDGDRDRDDNLVSWNDLLRDGSIQTRRTTTMTNLSGGHYQWGRYW
jgi:excinuclease UvrABC helicase subunit UvrB